MKHPIFTCGILAMALSTSASALEIIGGQPGTAHNGEPEKHHHQYHQGVVVFNLSDRQSIVETVNRGIRESGGYQRLVDRANGAEPKAAFYRGLVYLFGVSEKVNVEEGLRLLHIAHEDGVKGTPEQREATLLLADIYSGFREISQGDGRAYEVSTANKELAKTLVYVAAHSGHPVAERRLATYYWDGIRGYPYDRELALYWISSSAGKGDAASLDIWETWQDEVKATRSLWENRVEVSRGQAEALLKIAEQYYYGIGVGMDKARGLRLAKEAATLDVQGAKNLLEKWLKDVE